MALTFSWKNVTRQKFRTYLILSAIAISVGLESGIVFTIDSLYSDFIEDKRGNNYTDLSIYPKYIKDSNFEDLLVLADKVSLMKGIKQVSPVAVFSILKNDTGLENITNNVLLYGLDPTTHPDYLELDVGEEIALDPPDVIISMSIAQTINKYAGDIFTIPANTQLGFMGVNATIRGIMSDKVNFGGYVGYFFVLIDLNYLDNLFSSKENLKFHLIVRIDDLLNINNIANNLQDLIGLDYSVYREKAISETDILAIRSYQAGMNLIIIATIIVEFLFISNVLSINIQDRAKEFGILKAVGSSNLQIIKFLGLEILIYSIIGSLGNFIGIIFSFLSVFIINLIFVTIQIDSILIKPTSLIGTFIIAFLIVFIAAFYPVLKAIRLPIIQNIHWKTRPRSKTKSRYSLYSFIIGTIMLLLGLVNIEAVRFSDFLVFQIFSIPFFIIVLIFGGFFLIEIGLIRYIPSLGMKLLIWYKSVPRLIATRNVGREPQKTTYTIMVTALALSFILIIGILSTSLIESVPVYYEERYGRIDIIAETNDNSPIPISFLNELGNFSTNFERIDFIQQQRTVFNGNTEGYVFGVNSDSYSYFFEETMITPSGINVSLLLNDTNMGAIITDRLLSKIGARIGDNISIQVNTTSEINVRLTGIALGNPFLQEGYYMYISHLLYQKYWLNNVANWYVIKLNPNVENPSILASQLAGKYSLFREVVAIEFYARTIREALKSTNLFFQMLIIYAFLLSAMAQFLSTLTSSLRIERELGIMRSMGLSQKDVVAILSVESILIGTSGILFGIMNGLIGTDLLRWWISFSIPIQAIPSSNFILVWIIISFIITIATSKIVSGRIKDMVIAHAIYAESTMMMRKKRIEWHDWSRLNDSKFDY